MIATARNERQAKAIVDEVRLRMKKDEGRLPARAEGEGEARWVLVDYLDCVLHVQVPEVRDRYRLERLWGEAERLELGLRGRIDGLSGRPRPSDAGPSVLAIASDRFKRSLFGYRPREVDEALALRDAALAVVSAQLDRHAAKLEGGAGGSSSWRPATDSANGS